MCIITVKLFRFIAIRFRNINVSSPSIAPKYVEEN